MEDVLKLKIRFRRSTASDWTTKNPVLLSGEPAVETDTGKFKIGDGVKTWTALPYVGGGGTGDTPALILDHNQSPAAHLDIRDEIASKVDNADARLTDDRTPKPHNHVQSDVTGLSTAYDHSQVVMGNPHGTTAGDITSGTFDAARIPDLDAAKITSGTVAQARLGSGSAGAGAKFLADDQTYKTVSSGIADPGGANDDFLQRKSGAWTYRTPAQVKTDLGVPLNYVAPRVTGEWYSTRGPVATAVLGGTNATTGRLQCIPVYLHAGTIDRIGVYTTSAGSGTTWRLGIYPSDTGGIPDGQARLIDAGTVDMGATAGLLAITISQSIATAGLYWLVCLSDAYSANPTVYAWNAQSMPIQELEGLPTFFASNPERSGWMRTATGVTTGSIPSTCPTLAWANSGPKIAVRAA